MQLSKQAYRYVIKILFCKFLPNFMMMTLSIQKLWPFSQPLLLEFSEKQTAVNLKRIDQLTQNLARIHNLVVCFERSHKNCKIVYSSYCFHCFLLFIYCPSFVLNLTPIRGTRCSLMKKFDAKL